MAPHLPGRSALCGASLSYSFFHAGAVAAKSSLRPSKAGSADRRYSSPQYCEASQGAGEGGVSPAAVPPVSRKMSRCEYKHAGH
jgi:hypothetical protein